MAIEIENPDCARRAKTFLDGSARHVAELPSVFIGKGVYLPGWRWSEHAGRQTGVKSQHHIGYIQSGHMLIQGPDGETATVAPGDAFEIGPDHDAFEIGPDHDA